MRGMGRALFVAILLMIAGTLNVIYGIAAVGNAHFYDHTQYVFSSLKTWGWVTILIGIIQLGAGVSLAGGNLFGRVIGIFGAGVGSIEALLSVGGPHPFWALGVFALCLWILYGLIIYDEEPERPRRDPVTRA